MMISGQAYRSHTSTFKCLGLRSVDELYDWYRSDLFKPFWVKFYNGYLRPARSHSADNSRGPALPRIIMSIELGEQFGKQRYSAEAIDTTHWGKDEYLLFKVTNVNKLNCVTNRHAGGALGERRRDWIAKDENSKLQDKGGSGGVRAIYTWSSAARAWHVPSLGRR